MESIEVRSFIIKKELMKLFEKSISSFYFKSCKLIEKSTKSYLCTKIYIYIYIYIFIYVCVLRTYIPIFSIDRNYKIFLLNPREPELHNLTNFSQYIKFYNKVNKTMMYRPHHISVHFDISLFRFSFCLNVN